MNMTHALRVGLMSLIGAAGVAMLGVAAWRMGLVVRGEAEQGEDSAVRQALIDTGHQLTADIERVTRPAMIRGRKLAADPATMHALRSGDQAELTRVCNDAIMRATEIDAVALFDAKGEIVAINTVYADGTQIPPERVDRVLAMNFATQGIVQHCVGNTAAEEVLEFQTTCDITPALFQSSGLSVAHSVPVVGEGGKRLGVVSTRLRFERVTELVGSRSIAEGNAGVRFVTDRGGFFDEALNRGGVAPIPAAELAAIAAPLSSGRVAMITVEREGMWHGLFRMKSLPTPVGGGIQTMISVPSEWLRRGTRAASALAIGTPAGMGVLLLMVWSLIRSRAQTERRALQAKKALCEVEAFRVTLDTHSIVSVADRSGRIIEANAPFCTISGYSRAELIGQDHRILNSGVHPKAFWVAIWKQLAAGKAWRGEVCNRAKDGTLYWVDSIIAPFLGPDGKVEKYVSIRNDITAAMVERGKASDAELFVRNTIDSLNSHTVVLGSDGKIRAYNRAWQEFAFANGGVREAVLGGADYLAVCDRSSPQCEEARKVGAAIRAVLAGDAIPPSIEYACHGIDEQRWFVCSVRGFSLRDERFAVISHSNITALKQAEAELRGVTERFEMATKAGGVGTWEYDVVQNRLVWDDQMFRLYGITRERFGAVYEAWQNGVHVDDRERVSAEVQAALKGERDFETDFRVSWPDGSMRVIRAVAKVQRDEAGRALRMVGTNWDITKRKQIEERLVIANKELSSARQAAEAASKAKSEFLANMSHEIRTPLTAILGFADLLRDEEDGVGSEQRAQAVDTIRRAGTHLLTVINDILDLSKVEADRMSVERIETPLVSLLMEVESLMKPRATGKGISLSVALRSPVPDRVMSDPTRLRQILMNLVGNAVKFTDAGGVAIGVGSESGQGETRLVIDIEDTGSGMNNEQRTRIFQAFGQADATVTRKHGGTGLGLTICSRLARLMGGDVKLVRTELGKGSCFRLVLPMQAAPGSVLVTTLDSCLQNVDAAVGQAEVRLNGRVLFAEDGVDNRRLIGFHLRRAGANVEVAENGRIALEMFERAASEGRPYDLLLTDMQMPEMDGYTLARTLRARGSRVAIVALTAHAMAEHRAKCCEAGCDDYASKPIDKAKLLATCAAWIGKPGGLRAMEAAA